MSNLTTREFWASTLEHAVRTAAQTAIALIGTDQVGLHALLLGANRLCRRPATVHYPCSCPSSAARPRRTILHSFTPRASGWQTLKQRKHSNGNEPEK